MYDLLLQFRQCTFLDRGRVVMLYYKRYLYIEEIVLDVSSLSLPTVWTSLERNVS